MAKKKEILLSFTDEEKEVIINISIFLITQMNASVESVKDTPTHLLPVPNLIKVLKSQIETCREIKKNPDIIFNTSFEKKVLQIVNYLLIVEQVTPVMNVKLNKSLQKKITTLISANKQAGELLRRSKMDMNPFISESEDYPKKNKKIPAEAAKIIKLNVSKKRTPPKRIN